MFTGTPRAALYNTTRSTLAITTSPAVAIDRLREITFDVSNTLIYPRYNPTKSTLSLKTCSFAPYREISDTRNTTRQKYNPTKRKPPRTTSLVTIAPSYRDLSDISYNIARHNSLRSNPSLTSWPFIAINPQREISDVTGNVICPNMVRGIDHLNNARLNKGLAFTLEERQALGLHGLLAPRIMTQEDQLEICKISIDRYKDPLNQHLFLIELQDTIEKLFFSLINTNVEKYMPMVYTPTVGLVCQKFGLVYRKPRGVFISYSDKGHIYDVLKCWPESDVKAICFTDGERILGLGDLGAYGMGIPVGKLALYTALAGVKPHQCLPIMLDVGTNNESLLTDPLYIGLRMKRLHGEKYYEFINEFMCACTKRFGPHVLLQFEDFSLSHAMPLLAKYREHFCTFNDDVQGTASVSVAGLFAALRITKNKLSDHIYLFLGAGSAANGIAQLCVLAMKEEGTSEEAARKKIFMFDIDGLVTSRRKGGVPSHIQGFGTDMEPEKNFEKSVAAIKPTVLIGCSTVGGAFTTKILQQMGKNAKRPIIFALSNPTAKSECTAQAAYDNTEGRCIFASGSPFPPVKYKGKEYRTGQGNNSYIFPGLALGVIAASAYKIPDTLFLTAAKCVANMVQESDLELGRIYPPLSALKEVSFKIATEVVKQCYEKGLATINPKPHDIEAFVQSHIYSLEYDCYVPLYYKYPELPSVNVRSFADIRGKTPDKDDSAPSKTHL